MAIECTKMSEHEIHVATSAENAVCRAIQGMVASLPPEGRDIGSILMGTLFGLPRMWDRRARG